MQKDNNIDEVYVTSMSRLNRDIKCIINMCRDMHGYGTKVNLGVRTYIGQLILLIRGNVRTPSLNNA